MDKICLIKTMIPAEKLLWYRMNFLRLQAF